LLLGLAAFDAQAIQDEIQVYTDDLDLAGERGLELHVNTTPSGRKTPNYDGDVPPYRGLRITPEFSWGLGHDMDWGLYVPTAFDSDGKFYPGGIKARFKWLPIRAEKGGAGWYAGANIELDRLNKSFSESPWSTELRVMGGYRAQRWLLGFNPIFDWNLSPGFRGSPDVTLTYKAVYEIVENWSFGAEYYHDTGTLAQRLPHDEQQRTLYAIAEYEGKSWSLNFGVGHGLTPATDNWTVKAIFGFSFD
jgi:hypothetical protein